VSSETSLQPAQSLNLSALQTAPSSRGV
jgi:hypothetical protein